jgi:Flp pilus assembly secretin CpaC
MFERSLSVAAAEAILAVLMVSQPVSAGTEPMILDGAATRAIEVTSDSAIVIESDRPFGELSIANPEIADISTISGSSLYVLGKRPGRTTLMLMGDDGRVFSVMDIRVAPDVTELKRRLSEVLPGEQIEVLTAKDGLVLSGIVSTPAMINRAIELAGHYAPGKISNLLTVRPAEPISEPVPATVEEEQPVVADPKEIEAQLRQILPNEEISVHLLGGAFVISGNVSSSERAEQALEIARLVAGETAITNLMTVAEQRTCTVRTRRGGELVQSEIPCRSNAKAEANGTASVSFKRHDTAVGMPGPESTEEMIDVASVSPLAPVTSPIPLPRPYRS